MRHGDPRLGPYTPAGAVVRSAVELGPDVEGLRLGLASTKLSETYGFQVPDDSEVQLRRLT